jgi:hypothetical protein
LVWRIARNENRSKFEFSHLNRQEIMKIDPKYIVDESNRKIAVQLDIKTFEKIEEILENYGLVQLMSSEDSKETLDLDQARSYYNSLEKAE